MKKIIGLICAICIIMPLTHPAEAAEILVFSDNFSAGRGNFTGHGAPYVSVVTEGASKYLSIREGYYAARYFNLYKGAKYRLTSNARCGREGKFTLSYFDESGVAIGTKTRVIGDTGGAWTTAVYEFTFQKSAQRVCIFMHSGDYDDFTLTLIREPPRFFNDVQFVYYTQLVNADIKITPNTEYFGTALSDNVINLEVSDGNTVTYSVAGISASTENNISIPITTAMPIYGKDYIIKIDCCNSAGSVLYTFSQDISRFSRPSMLDSNGKIVIDNKPFVPVIGYTTPPSTYQKALELGINVVASTTADSSDPDGLFAMLEAAGSAGFKVLAVFYNTYKTATSTVAYQKTVAAVEKIQNHPALFGYMVMDEPGNEDTMIAELKSTYKLIRSLDRVHPVYLCECMPYAYEDIVKCADILCVDPYPTTSGNLITYVSDRVNIAKAVVLGRQKTLTAVFRAFYSSSLYQTANEMRHMAYQALLCGVDGIGWFNIGAFENQGSIWDRTTIWDGVSYFAAEEQEDALPAFCLNEYEICAENTEAGQPVWWKGFEKDGNIHLIVLNNTAAEQSPSVPVTHDGGIFTLNMTISGGDILRLVLEKTSWGFIGCNIVSGGSEAVGIAENLTLKGKITAVNLTDTPLDARAILTLNSGKTTNAVEIEQVTIPAGEAFSVETGKNLVTSEKTTDAKLFIWGGNMQPYTKRKVCN